MISIIIPTYNRAHLIGETLDSIIAQTYQNWECIIVDDRSTDNTEEVLKEYLKNDARIVFYKKPDDMPKGPSAARNYGFQKSKGEYINFFDSDDLMHPQKLDIDLKNIKSVNYDFTISQTKFFKKDGIPKKIFWNDRLWSNDPLNDFIIKDIGWSPNSVLWNKDSLKRNKILFDEQLITADDYFFHIEALIKGMKPYVNKDVLVYQREHEHRLNDYKDKSPFKLRVAFHLLSKESLNLNKAANNYLIKMSFAQASHSFKHKNYRIGVIYIFKFLNLRKFKDYKLKLLKLLYFGTTYKMLGQGYRFLNINTNSNFD